MDVVFAHRTKPSSCWARLACCWGYFVPKIVVIALCIVGIGVWWWQYTPAASTAQAIVLGLAFLFTLAFTVLQYSGEFRRGFRSGTYIIVIFVIVGLTLCWVSAFAKLIPHVDNRWLLFVYQTLPGRWAFLFPSWKNVAVFAVACLFFAADCPKGKHVVREDITVCLSIFFSSMLLGVIRKYVSPDFVEGYNVGAMVFHLILGTILYSPGDVFTIGKETAIELLKAHPPAQGRSVCLYRKRLDRWKRCRATLS